MTNEGISPLRRRMIEDMTVRTLSPTTRPSYIHNVKKFSLHFGRSPPIVWALTKFVPSRRLLGFSTVLLRDPYTSA